MRVLLAMLPLMGCGGPVLETGDPVSEACDDGAPFDEYVAGLSRDTLNDTYTLELTADPAPPDVGDITFSLAVNTNGQPFTEGAVEVRPWMPLHGHGTVPEILEATSDGAGTFAVPTVDLFMPGLWELYVTVSQGDDSDEGLYRFCLEG